MWGNLAISDGFYLKQFPNNWSFNREISLGKHFGAGRLGASVHIDRAEVLLMLTQQITSQDRLPIEIMDLQVISGISPYGATVFTGETTGAGITEIFFSELWCTLGLNRALGLHWKIALRLFLSGVV
ncbi:hypothetical protein SLA2020_094490 [Shorea laevis]